MFNRVALLVLALCIIVLMLWAFWLALNYDGDVSNLVGFVLVLLCR